MKLVRVLGIVVLALMLSAIPVCRADDAAADPLKDKGLAKAGSVYVLPAEKELADAMRDLRKLYAKLQVDGTQRRKLESQLHVAKGAISQWEYQRRGLYDQYTKLTDVSQKNDTAAKIKVLESKLTEADGIRQDLEKQLNGLGAEDKSQFVNTVLDLSVKVDKAQDDYKGLTDDPDVKAVIEKPAEPGKSKLKLGPSPEFVANANMLKKWRGDVSSDTIQLKHDNGVPSAEVTLNGTVVREMVVDSGASMVCLTNDLATQLKMIPTDKDEKIQFTMADGKVVEAWHMVLKSVRVGQFTVTDVDCAVLPANLVAAEPLLGGTFLNNFVFKVDPTAGELHLAAIAGNAKVTTIGGAKDKKPAASASEK